VTETVARYRSLDFVHRIRLSKIQHHWQMNQWCQEQFGPRWEATGNQSGRWCVSWLGLQEDYTVYEWLFVNEADALLFMLRWT
jgi:hypothetical protein